MNKTALFDGDWFLIYETIVFFNKAKNRTS